MVTFLITSFFILACLAIAIYFWQKPAASTEAEALRPPPGRGLFIDGTPEGRALALTAAASETSANAALQRAELLERARGGDKSALLDANNSEDDLYNGALNLIIAGADSDPKLLALVSYLTSHELRVSKRLAEKVIESYKTAPDRGSTAKMLHVAALSDDAAIYQNAAETALRFWREHRLPQVSAPELRSILEGEFWILSASTRNSGAGFLLKRTLANARRELEAAQND
ncbi:MAG TPA: hypothetical protein VF961_05480 [Pyrinomonadaceae bacterium]